MRLRLDAHWRSDVDRVIDLVFTEACDDFTLYYEQRIVNTQCLSIDILV